VIEYHLTRLTTTERTGSNEGVLIAIINILAVDNLIRSLGYAPDGSVGRKMFRVLLGSLFK
jgi:hypothetical protein